MRMAVGMLAVAAAMIALGGCTHVHGVVEQSTGRPLSTAVFSIGRPDGIAVYATHPVDSRGRFDFSISPTDEDNVYVYDGAADPRLTLRRVDRREMGENMRLLVPAANPNVDIGPGTP